MAVDGGGGGGGGGQAREELSVSSPAASKPSPKPEEEIRAVAQKLSDQPLHNSDRAVWAVLTAISKKARQRPQGMHILLSGNEHPLGRIVDDVRFQVTGPAISSSHCKISRETVKGDLPGSVVSVSVFLKDTSTNGTYLNWIKLRKDSAKAKLQHGDIISFVHPPHDEKAFAFVYREVNSSIGLTNGAALKRKSEDFNAESKRHKGIGIGAPEGPISLDDVRSLQRSNTELRQQLEFHVNTVETMRSENRAITARHENELKELKEKVSGSFFDQIKSLQDALDAKHRDLEELNTSSSELRHSIEDLNERLRASMQSRNDADQIIHSQTASIAELETQLDEERNQRRVDREKAEADLKSALQKVHSETQEEIKRQADVYLRQHKEQQEVISKLQESEKESRLLVEALRSKLEDARESLVMSEQKVRQLEAQVQDEQMVSANYRKKSETLDSELRRMRKELENEKVAREEAWAKVSALELEISAAIRDLSMEKQRFQGARERVILRETQLRAFYSTTEEISSLFAKQQEQLKSMQRTLEDEDNYENSWMGIDLNEPAAANIILRVRDETHPRNKDESCGASTPKNVHASNENTDQEEDDDDDASTTEKHDCNNLGSQDCNTQDIECTSSDRLLKGFGSDIDGLGTAMVTEGDPTDAERGPGTETECVPGTESPAANLVYDERSALQKCSNLAGETMQLDDDETQIPENLELAARNRDGGSGHGSPSRMEDTETGTIRTADLLASEVAGSWAMSTAPSVNGENETPRSPGDGDPAGDNAAALLVGSDGQASGSQSNAACGIAKLSEEHRALGAMIDIVAPEFKQQFPGDKIEVLSDAETEGSEETGEADDTTEDDNDVMIEDSVG